LFSSLHLLPLLEPVMNSGSLELLLMSLII
jgi:hypothetical protein